MGDILSQDEIDALLSSQEVDDLRKMLVKWGLENKQIAGLYRELIGQVGGGTPIPDIVAAAVQRVLTSLGDVELSSSQTKELEKEITNMANEKKSEKKKPENNRIITTYDFKHPARVNRDQLRTLENLHDNFARLLSSTFSGAMRRSSTSTRPSSTRRPTPSSSCRCRIPAVHISSPWDQPTDRPSSILPCPWCLPPSIASSEVKARPRV